MSDDITRRLQIFQNDAEVNIDDEYIQQYVLYEIEFLLNSSANPTSLAAYGLPTLREDLLASLQNRLLMEERNYDREHLATEHAHQKSRLRGQQLKVYEAVINAVEAKKQILLFVYGHGGTGKTFLWTTIINALRSQGKIVLAVAASGIASLLLPSGRTAHSRFKLPYDIINDRVTRIGKNTNLSKLLIETSLIIWDEAPMSDRRCFEFLDRNLKDILDNDIDLFGGMPVLLGGDFRQTLPVKRKTSKSEIIAASLPKSYIWEHFSVVKLTENMRLRNAMNSNIDVTEITSFATWLLEVGDRRLGTPDEKDPHDTRLITIPPQFIISQSEMD